MRILQLRCTNLNSLVGDWVLDFTHPAFSAEGLFAITGPTGAGKTTVLDAICLALYGQTPRLGKITKGSNEIMSRHTGICSAEVTFCTQKGSFRCHWSQRRARQQSTGELQTPRHEISDASSGALLATKKNSVVETVAHVTGMNFERFTRSMLLAQGEFAAFLNASPSERAPILEQLTGTELYSHISMRVYQRKEAEREQLKTLQLKLAGLPLLSAEAEQQLNDDLQQHINHEQRVNDQLAGLVQHMQWLETLQQLENQQRQLSEDETSLQQQCRDFLPHQARLKRAQQALELSGDYATLTALRQTHHNTQSALKNAQQSIPQHINNAQIVIRDFAAAHDMLVAHQQRDQQHLHRQQEELNTQTAQLKNNAQDQRLITELAGLQQQVETIERLRQQQVQQHKDIATAAQRVEITTQDYKDQLAFTEKAQQHLEAKQALLTAADADYRAHLAGRELSAWHHQHQTLIGHQEHIKQLLNAVESRTSASETIHYLNERRETCIAMRDDLITTLTTQQTKQTALEHEIDALEARLGVLQQIESLVEMRHQLEDGTPCPLCGATDHPFAAGNVPTPDATRQQLVAKRQALKKLVKLQSEQRIEEAKLTKDLEQIAAAHDQQTQQLASTNEQITTLAAALSSILTIRLDDPNLAATLSHQQQTLADQLSQINTTLMSIENSGNQLAQLRETVAEAKEAIADQNRNTQTAQHQQDLAQEKLKTLSEHAATLQTQHNQAVTHLQAHLMVFGVTAITVDDLQPTLAQLTARAEQWQHQQQTIRALEREIDKLTLEGRHQQQQLAQQQHELNKQREYLAQQMQRFGVRDDPLSKLPGAVIAAPADALEHNRQQWERAQAAFERLITQISTLEHNIASQVQTLEPTAQRFVEKLHAADFSDESSYRAACLAETERAKLQQQAQTLADAETALQLKIAENRVQLEQQRAKALTSEPLASLQSIHAQLLDEQKTRQHTIGGLNHQLNEHRKLKKQQGQLLTACENQHRECSHWETLNHLIGSADGKKYRNFVQGLTFSQLVSHANQQLQQMTDRYLLVHDDTRPLELNVIDHYQAAVTRSTKNLSGGESFIVSLALALGLSRMASEHVRVESLFLDEGFGTLDEEALESALQTLASLQHNGTLIGVISHVAALKERISTQIEVIPEIGGRSRIKTPADAESHQRTSSPRNSRSAVPGASSNSSSII